MTKLLLIAAFMLLVVASALIACSADVTTTTATATASTTPKIPRAVATLSSTTTSTTQPVVVWQTIRYEQNTPGLVYSGRWTHSSAEPASKGSFVYADSDGASLTFRFVGSYCGWLAKTSDQYGKAAITVDEGAASTVDLYSKETMWRHVVWETKSLPFGEHTVKIDWTGKKNTGSKATRINMDAVEIVGALVGRYQQTNPHFEYSGRWATSKDASASGGSFALTKSSHSSITVNFTGIQIDWFAKEGPAYGRAQVVVDEGDPVTVDLYSAEVLWVQNVWSSGRLEMGPHVVKIQWTGAKNPASSGTYINLDAFEIAGVVD
jgi:hypothetical protein